ncbi:MAG: hypothetical protein IJM32_04055 [Ruminococcus sp.]|nr:hypothetical protein [Ruminococcus sp.]
MATIKELMQDEFRFLFNRLRLSEQVDWFDILLLNNRESITVKLDFGKVDDGEYVLERRGAKLCFYRKGYFNKILLYTQEGDLIACTPKTLNKAHKKVKTTAVEVSMKSYPRFFAAN